MYLRKLSCAWTFHQKKQLLPCYELYQYCFEINKTKSDFLKKLQNIYCNIQLVKCFTHLHTKCITLGMEYTDTCFIHTNHCHVVKIRICCIVLLQLHLFEFLSSIFLIYSYNCITFNTCERCVVYFLRHTRLVSFLIIFIFKKIILGYWVFFWEKILQSSYVFFSRMEPYFKPESHANIIRILKNIF